MTKPDLRATLRAIAAGNTPANDKPRCDVLAAADVRRDHAAFSAWRAFVRAVGHDEGEPLAAPSATLSPLP